MAGIVFISLKLCYSTDSLSVFSRISSHSPKNKFLGRLETLLGVRVNGEWTLSSVCLRSGLTDPCSTTQYMYDNEWILYRRKQQIQAIQWRFIDSKQLQMIFFPHPHFSCCRFKKFWHQLASASSCTCPHQCTHSRFKHRGINTGC